MADHSAIPPDARLRRLILAIVVLGISGLAIELLLLEHTDSLTQWIPLVVLGAGLAATVGVVFAPGSGSLLAFRGVMFSFVVAGVVGLYLHFVGNVEWARERDPELAGMALVWEALTGATPALAPGAIVQLGLLGLVYAWSAARVRTAPGAGRIRKETSEPQARAGCGGRPTGEHR